LAASQRLSRSAFKKPFSARTSLTISSVVFFEEDPVVPVQREAGQPGRQRGLEQGPMRPRIDHTELAEDAVDHLRLPSDVDGHLGRHRHQGAHVQVRIGRRHPQMVSVHARHLAASAQLEQMQHPGLGGRAFDRKRDLCAAAGSRHVGCGHDLLLLSGGGGDGGRKSSAAASS